MEHGCYEFNADLSQWNVSRVLVTEGMFEECYALTGYLGKLGRCVCIGNMKRMFLYCVNFRGDLSNWPVSQVFSFDSVFAYCLRFTGQGVRDWDASNCHSFRRMFEDCYLFNAGLTRWNVHYSSSSFNPMLKDCHEFNCDLSQWKIRDGCDVERMLYHCRRSDTCRFAANARQCCM